MLEFLYLVVFIMLSSHFVIGQYFPKLSQLHNPNNREVIMLLLHDEVWFNNTLSNVLLFFY